MSVNKINVNQGVTPSFGNKPRKHTTRPVLVPVSGRGALALRKPITQDQVTTIFQNTSSLTENKSAAGTTKFYAEANLKEAPKSVWTGNESTKKAAKANLDKRQGYVNEIKAELVKTTDKIKLAELNENLEIAQESLDRARNVYLEKGLINPIETITTEAKPLDTISVNAKIKLDELDTLKAGILVTTDAKKSIKPLERILKDTEEHVIKTAADVKAAIVKAETEMNAAKQAQAKAIHIKNHLQARRQKQIIQDKRTILNILNAPITANTIKSRPMKTAMFDAVIERDKAQKEYAHAMDYYIPKYKAEYNQKLVLKQSAVDKLKAPAAAEALKAAEAEAKDALEVIKETLVEFKKIAATDPKLKLVNDAIGSKSAEKLKDLSDKTIKEGSEKLKEQPAKLRPWMKAGIFGAIGLAAIYILVKVFGANKKAEAAEV